MSKVAEVGGAGVLPLSHSHVGLQRLKHCILGQGRVGGNRLEVGPPIRAHHHEAVASEFGLKLGPQHWKPIEFLGGKHAVMLAASRHAHLAERVA